ncbi:MAG: preprotein translocase subunit YajC [Anaerolineae bacterium]|nr:preprotein translocase subunit YajC [Anaerolineae bacterium]
MEQLWDWGFWLVLIVLFMALVYVPQWTARRRRKQQEASLAVGDRIVTIGGFMGTLVYLNSEENLARIALADNVVVDILPGAISGKRVAEQKEPPKE